MGMYYNYCWSINGPEPGGQESMTREWKKERGQ